MTRPMYWNSNGKYQKLYDELWKLIPDYGEVKNPDKNPALEKLRIASKCYYDLYNNGMGNMDKEFKNIFGFEGTDISQRKNNNWYSAKLERKIDVIILAAAKEQGIKIEDVE